MLKPFYALPAIAGVIFVNTIHGVRTMTEEEYIRENAPKVNLRESVKKETVIKVAELILTDVYGSRVLEERPWIVEDREDSDMYVIKGTFHRDEGKVRMGGVAEIVLLKKNLQVIRCTHGK